MIDFKESVEDTYKTSLETSAIQKIKDPISRQVALTEAKLKRE